MTDLSFTLGTELGSGPGRHGRTGTIHTPHGDIQTPAFIPVATKATVKTLTPEQIEQTGAQAILSNAYHLYLQPGADIVDEAGGVGRFENWSGPTYTDSGGFQVWSLRELRKLSEEGVRFQSPINGDSVWLTPERSIEVQQALGSDVIMQFDECTPHPATEAQARARARGGADGKGGDAARACLRLIRIGQRLGQRAS